MANVFVADYADWDNVDNFRIKKEEAFCLLFALLDADSVESFVKFNLTNRGDRVISFKNKKEVILWYSVSKD